MRLALRGFVVRRVLKSISRRAVPFVFIHSACSISTLDSDNFVIMVQLADFTRVCAGEHNLGRLKCKLVFELTIAKGVLWYKKKTNLMKPFQEKKKPHFSLKAFFNNSVVFFYHAIASQVLSKAKRWLGKFIHA
jgi:hypothetical protein